MASNNGEKHFNRACTKARQLTIILQGQAGCEMRHNQRGA